MNGKEIKKKNKGKYVEEGVNHKSNESNLFNEGLVWIRLKGSNN